MSRNGGGGGGEKACLMHDLQKLMWSDMLQQHAAVPVAGNMNYTHWHKKQTHSELLSPSMLLDIIIGVWIATDKRLYKIKYNLKTQGGEELFFQQAL